MIEAEARFENSVPSTIHAPEDYGNDSALVSA
jgi:hypothetical protein